MLYLIGAIARAFVVWMAMTPTIAARRVFVTLSLALFSLGGCGGGASSPPVSDAGDELSSRDGASPDLDVADAIAEETSAATDVQACATGQTLCGDACIDLQTDATHCGSCDGNCRGLPGVNGLTITCVRGVCAVHDHCAEGFADCDTLSENGCEASLTQPSSCGACGITCSGSTPACTLVAGDGGVPTRVCSSGCAPSTPTRCGETCSDTQTDPLNCGACGNRCSFSHAVSSCIAGVCAPASCASTFADCDRDATNGCETALSTLYDCGACGRACPMPTGPHAGARCISSGVTFACDLVCESGYTDCDSNLMNGCEATVGNCTREEVLFTEHFETALTRWTLGFPWRPYDSFLAGRIPYAGRGSLVGIAQSTDPCRTAGDATMTADIDVSRTTALTLQFVSYSFRGRSDAPAISVSTDRGATWTTVDTFSLSTSSGWTSYSVNLHAFIGRPTLRFRFHYQSECPGPYLEWNIDDVTLQASVRNY